uniref:Uncharacterized protein n=1 Tax=Setaria italica TaxID=4555 RepID=K3YZH2_SETIT
MRMQQSPKPRAGSERARCRDKRAPAGTERDNGRPSLPPPTVCTSNLPADGSDATYLWPPAAVPPGGREAGGLRGDPAGDGDDGHGAVPRRGAAEGPRAGAAGLRRHARRRRWQRRLHHPAFRRRCHE